MLRKTLAWCAALALGTASTTSHADPACRRAAVAIVLDRSGSMSGKPIADAKAGASAAVDGLGSDDCVTVIAFDSTPTTVVTLHALTDAPAVKQSIAGIQAGGGTEIFAALQAAHRALASATHARKKHVVLLTDGMSPVAGLQQLATTMSGEHMTITTIGLGDSTDEQTLQMLASTGGGRFYRVKETSNLPRIFSREVSFVLVP